MDLYELAVRFKSEGFRAVSKDMDTLDKKGKGIATAFSALKASLIVGAVGTFIRKIAVESIEAQKQTAQLNAVLKSTGGIADVTAGEIDKIAGSLQRTTTFSDDAVKSSAALLLTFTNIRGEIFRQTLPAITDMATALGTDLNAATLQVGKALQDPVRGITALRRAGVSFSEAQQAVIKNLVETNRLAEAQGIILKELSVQFGGSAAAARNTLGGALEGLKNSWGELFEVTTDGTVGVVGAINRLSDALDRNKEKWQGWASSILDANGGAVPVFSSIVRFMNKIVELQNKIGAWLHGGAGMGRGGGGGGGRDTPTGPLTLPGAVVMAGKASSPLGGGGGGTGKGKASGFPGTDINFDGLRQFEPGGEPVSDEIGGGVPDWMTKLFGDQDLYREKLAEWKARVAKDTADASAELKETILSGISQTLGDAVYNGFAAAFSGEGIGGIFKAFGKTILAGLGNIMAQQGQALLAYGITMQAAAMGLTNPFTAGPAAIAAGLALIALGAAFGAAAKGGGGRGTAQAGAFREPSRGSDDITRFKFIDRNGNLAGTLTPRPSVHFTLIGANDPKVQREIGEIVEKFSRRVA